MPQVVVAIDSKLINAPERPLRGAMDADGFRDWDYEPPRRNDWGDAHQDVTRWSAFEARPDHVCSN
jgi:hypothetical protein